MVGLTTGLVLRLVEHRVRLGLVLQPQVDEGERLLLVVDRARAGRRRAARGLIGLLVLLLLLELGAELGLNTAAGLAAVVLLKAT